MRNFKLNTLGKDADIIPTADCYIYALAKIEATPQELANFAEYIYAGDIYDLLSRARKLGETTLENGLKEAYNVMMKKRIKKLRDCITYDTHSSVEQFIKTRCSLDHLCGMLRNLDNMEELSQEERDNMRGILDEAIRKRITFCLVDRDTTKMPQSAMFLISSSEPQQRLIIEKYVREVLANPNLIEDAYEQQIDNDLLTIIQSRNTPYKDICKFYSLNTLFAIERHLNTTDLVPIDLRPAIRAAIEDAIFTRMSSQLALCSTEEDIKKIIVDISPKEREAAQKHLDALMDTKRKAHSIQ